MLGITILKWDNTCHLQHHGTKPPVHFCCSLYISPCFLSLSLSLSLPLSLSLSLSLPLFPSFSLSHPLPLLSLRLPLSLSLSMSLCGCKTRVIWCPLPNILFLINLTFHTLSLHSSYKNSPTIHRLSFTTTILRAAWKTSFSLSGQPSSSFHWKNNDKNWDLRDLHGKNWWIPWILFIFWVDVIGVSKLDGKNDRRPLYLRI